MFEAIQNSLLRFLRVPPEPEPPFGDPASIRVFRASRKLYLLRLFRWGLTQATALAGIIFWFSIILVSEHEAERVRAQNPQGGMFSNLPAGRNQVTLQPLSKIPHSLFAWLWIAKGVGLLIYGSQLVVTYVAVRLDYQLRWYMVTDRSLRIRSGIWNVQEVTMSYANLQQVVVSQGPLERLLGIANVRVESAGGGAKNSGDSGSKAATMHSGVFHGVENAEEIRDLIIERLRRFRESGLGDPDEAARGASQNAAAMQTAAANDILDAGRELLAEARRFRAELNSGCR
ncbi:MAG TPA: PH domain-containing protein [Clostridia bacterium]|nr:PH domain-containing protein [Clostridia bacterium]